MQDKISVEFAIAACVNKKFAACRYRGNPVTTIHPIEILKYNTELGRTLHRQIHRDFDMAKILGILNENAIYGIFAKSDNGNYTVNLNRVIGSDIHQKLMSLTSWLHVTEPNRDIVDAAGMEDIFDYML